MGHECLCSQTEGREMGRVWGQGLASLELIVETRSNILSRPSSHEAPANLLSN